MTPARPARKVRENPKFDSRASVGKGEEFGALEVVEIRQAVERQPFGLRQHGQPLAAAGARRLVGFHLASERLSDRKTFPITTVLENISYPELCTVPVEPDVQRKWLYFWNCCTQLRTAIGRGRWQRLE